MWFFFLFSENNLVFIVFYIVWQYRVLYISYIIIILMISPKALCRNHKGREPLPPSGTTIPYKDLDIYYRTKVTTSLSWLQYNCHNINPIAKTETNYQFSTIKQGLLAGFHDNWQQATKGPRVNQAQKGTSTIVKPNNNSDIKGVTTNTKINTRKQMDHVGGDD